MNQRLEALQAWLRPEIRALQPYAAEPWGPKIRLDANESPADVPLALKAAILQDLAGLAWNRYPDPSARELRQALAQENQVSPEQIVLGNGSDELIQNLLLAYGGPGTCTVFPVPTFAMYRLLTLINGGQPTGVALKPDWSLDVQVLQAQLQKPTSRILFLPSPNNPTGNGFTRSQVLELLQSTDRLVVVDEAYRLFAGESLQPEMARFPNLAILNTFSKSMSLAGIRVGYLVAHPEVVAAINRVRLPYNLDSLAQHIACKVLEVPEIWRTQAEAVKQERQRIYTALTKIPGVLAYPSQANFILFRCPAARQLKQGLFQGGVAVRGFEAGEGLADCLRVTVGQPEENDQFLQLCQEIIGRGEGV